MKPALTEKKDAIIIFALTGHHPDIEFLHNIGIEIGYQMLVPGHSPEPLESNVPGIFLAGTVTAGRKNNRVFIENGCLHGKQVFKYLHPLLSLPSERSTQ